ncbi:hypothetical protein DCAR_0312729 [Daucus carota subsp. sativus]|uniref:NAC domain-containing protein n=1 Tax=Daucus carota subsp. sativus TaxID=79200 RepID=A0AAF0WSU7_DAUCS|nr:hypothetical protein DCAR_0312729 [Daucus carota subsp. sativus]
MAPNLPSDKQMIDSVKGVVCQNCCRLLDSKDVFQEWTNLPPGVKFDPTDVELLDHLADKCGIGNRRPKMFIDRFIITLQEEGGICYTHPEHLRGIKKDGSIAHYFYKSMNAYASGKRKRRKIQSNDSVRWHKTGKTKLVMENGVKKGYKKILVLYTTVTKGCKPVKSNWVMHQYHLGTEDDEKEGEYVVSKVFYQQRHNPISKEDSVCPEKDISGPDKQEDSKTNNDIKIDIVRTPAQNTVYESLLSITDTNSCATLEDDSEEIGKPSSPCKEDITSETDGITDLEDIPANPRVHSVLRAVMGSSLGWQG